MHGAGKVALLAQQVRRAQQHGGVAVVAAGVHLAGVAAGVGQAGGFGKGQGIHVGPQAHAGPGCAALKPWPWMLATRPVVPSPWCTGSPNACR